MPFFEKEKVLLIHIPKTGGTSIEKYFSKRQNIKLGPDQLYFSYYIHTIEKEITKYRKCWKHILFNKKKSLKNSKKNNNNLMLNRVLSFTSVDSLEGINREDIPEFKQFKKVKLSKDLQHSLQHLTWSEMQRYKDILFNNENDKKILSDSPYERNEYEILTIVRNPYDRLISELLFRNIINSESITRPKIVFSKIKKFLEKQDDIFDNHKLPQYLYLLNERGQMIENITILHTESLTDDMIRMGYTDFNYHFQVSKCKVKPGVTKYSEILNKEAIELINKYYKRDFELFNYSML